MKLFKYIWDENPATDMTLVWAESKEKAVEMLTERWKEDVDEKNIEEVEGPLLVDYSWVHDTGWIVSDDDQDTFMNLGDFEIDNGDEPLPEDEDEDEDEDEEEPPEDDESEDEDTEA